jgi:hydrogenase nickel incorporation protein HypA/HybF
MLNIYQGIYIIGEQKNKNNISYKMHELSITKDIMKMLEEECIKNKISHPRKIYLELGKFTNYKSDPIKFYFDALKKESDLLSQSEVVIEDIDCIIECNECHKECLIEDPIMIFCLHCRSSDVRIISGKEFNIRAIEE